MEHERLMVDDNTEIMVGLTLYNGRDYWTVYEVKYDGGNKRIAPRTNNQVTARAWAVELWEGRGGVAGQ